MPFSIEKSLNACQTPRRPSKVTFSAKHFCNSPLLPDRAWWKRRRSIRPLVISCPGAIAVTLEIGRKTLPSPGNFNDEAGGSWWKGGSIRHQDIDYLANSVSLRVKNTTTSQSGYEDSGCAHRDNLIRTCLILKGFLNV